MKCDYEKLIREAEATERRLETFPKGSLARCVRRNLRRARVDALLDIYDAKRAGVLEELSLRDGRPSFEQLSLCVEEAESLIAYAPVREATTIRLSPAEALSLLRVMAA